ncbi:cyclin-like protein, partial [Catenaria anguillulae PL171]
MTNDAAGNTVCADCGTVLEQDEIVAEVTFLEGSNGGHTALGGRVTADSVGRHALPGMGRSSGRNPTYDARQLITQYAHSLAVANDSVIESAHRLYTLAYIQKLTLGKRKTLVCAACLYIALRKERQAVMLIELAELVGVSVFKLGTVFMQLRREFPSVANVDDIDPSVYISRFAQALEFGNKTRDVANDAMLLVKRMQLDWIADGRRPAGICGACLLIAARMHHFHRTVKEIVHVVKMSDSTVIQRLREFSRTPAAQLSAKEFR